MVTKKITSLQHPFIKHLVKIRTDKNYRNENGFALISGKKLIRELSPVSVLLTTEEETCLPAEETIGVTSEILKKITGLQCPELVAALVRLPPPGNLEDKLYVLALDGISDPGNLGTLLRTALALGWEGVFFTEGSADPFNDKALRSAKGATFRIPLQQGNWSDLEKLIEKNKMHVLIADIEGEDVKICKTSAPLLLVLGNESHGASPHAKQRFSKITIPMLKHMESLNVASAGAILMHTLRGPI